MIKNTILPFLTKLRENNNKEWFTENKSIYLEAKTGFEQLIELIIAKLAEIDPLIKGLEAKNCIFRIHKDLRFSKNGLPYKTHFGAYMAVGGRKSFNPGYYLHLEPGSSFIAGGMYSPEPQTLKSIRTRLYNDPEEFKSIISDEAFKKDFFLYNEEMLKVAPRGFDKDYPDIGLLKYKHYAPISNVSDEELIHPEFIHLVLDKFERIKPFNDFLRETIES